LAGTSVIARWCYRNLTISLHLTVRLISKIAFCYFSMHPAASQVSASVSSTASRAGFTPVIAGKQPRRVIGDAVCIRRLDAMNVRARLIGQTGIYSSARQTVQRSVVAFCECSIRRANLCVGTSEGDRSAIRNRRAMGGMSGTVLTDSPVERRSTRAGAYRMLMDRRNALLHASFSRFGIGLHCRFCS
jgi:hypothetical protein